MRLPGLFTSLDDDCRELVAELIGVNLKPPMRGLLERKCKRGELLSRAQPHESALAHINIGVKLRCVARARTAVDPVRRDDEIGTGPRGLRVDFALESLQYTQRCGALLQNIQ